MGSWRPMTAILMSRSEIDRMNVLRDLAEKRIRVSEAATLIGLGRRQVLRLAKAFRQRGPAALAARRRGKPSNREAEGAGHVAVGQGTAATWPAQSHVQGRIARSKALQPRNQERGLPFTPKQ